MLLFSRGGGSAVVCRTIFCFQQMHVKGNVIFFGLVTGHNELFIDESKADERHDDMARFPLGSREKASGRNLKSDNP